MRVRLGDLLVEQGLITASQLESALHHQKRHPGFRKLGETLLALNLVTEEQLLHALARTLRIKAIDLRQVKQVEPAALRALDIRTAERELVLPLRFVHEGSRRRLQVAMADPTNLSAVDELQFRLGVPVEPCLSTISQVKLAIGRFYRRRGTLDMEGLIDIDMASVGDPMAPLGSEGVRSDATNSKKSGCVVELKFCRGPSSGASVQVADGLHMVFGRSPEVDYSVDDKRMSRRHFEIDARSNEVQLADLSSRNGTYLNQNRISRAELSDGDWVQAGNSLIKVEFIPKTDSADQSG